MEVSFIQLIEQVYKSDTLSDEDKKALITKIESDAVSTYMKKIDLSLGLGRGTTDGPFIASALKLHYDLITKSMNAPSLAYTNILEKRMASKIQYVNITIDIDALRKSLNPDEFSDESDDKPET